MPQEGFQEKETIIWRQKRWKKYTSKELGENISGWKTSTWGGHLYRMSDNKEEIGVARNNDIESGGSWGQRAKRWLIRSSRLSGFKNFTKTILGTQETIIAWLWYLRERRQNIITKEKGNWFQVWRKLGTTSQGNLPRETQWTGTAMSCGNTWYGATREAH